MNSTTTPARDTLREHLEQMAREQADAAALLHRAEGFGLAASTQQPSAARLEALQARRPGLLADVALSVADAGVLDELDRSITAAAEQAKAAGRAAEIAAAGRDKLLADHAVISGRITAMSGKLPALQYAAGVELATERLAAYRQALNKLGDAHAALAGACEATDLFASLVDQPRRMPTQCELHRHAFAAPLPSLPGVNAKDWQFDVTQQVAQAKASTLAELTAFRA